jgi:osomolarity two-component system sensor histidine kinase SLN1
MLKLEDVYDVVVAKDGQEAYDMVRESMSKNQFFDLIFMDIQVSHAKSPLHSHFFLTRLDA